MGIDGNRTYLPIFWTSYYVNHNYGNDRRKIEELQSFIDSLDKSKKYFTLVQYDDGILNDLSKIDCKVFGMGGGHWNYPLPLICQPHPYSFTTHRDIFCNFMGSLTHPIRKNLLPHIKKAGYLVNTFSIPIQDYCMKLIQKLKIMQVTGIEKGIKNVLADFDTTKLVKNDLQPYHTFSVNGNMNYYFNCTT